MQLKSILNHVEKIPGFVYERAQWSSDRSRIQVRVRARRNGHAICSGCGERAPGYDKLKARTFEFVPLWQIRIFLVYAMRRVNCCSCGVQVERVPWSTGKNRSTTTYLWFLSMWAKRISWDEVAQIFQSSWQTVSRAVEQAVEWGRQRVDLTGVESIGVDEILHRRGTKAYRGPRFLTLVYQIDEGRKRLLWIGKDRTEQTLHGFFDWLGTAATSKLKVVCSDMWPAYLKAIRVRAANAVQLLDRFHVMANMNKAIDAIRAKESRELQKQHRGRILKNSRWLFLKRQENLTGSQHEKLSVLLRQNLKIVRAYLMKESFQRFWDYTSRYAAGRFLDTWCDRVMRSRIGEMKKIAKSMRKHRDLLLNWFTARHASVGAVEGLNNKAKVTTRKSYGFRTFRIIELALYHSLGDLPEPKFTHRFW